MMVTIYGITRTKFGKNASRRLRLKNKFPAIVYFSLKSNLCIELDQDIFSNMEAKKINFHQQKIVLIIDNVKYIVKVHEIQRHAFKSKILHIDFLREY